MVVPITVTAGIVTDLNEGTQHQKREQVVKSHTLFPYNLAGSEAKKKKKKTI